MGIWFFLNGKLCASVRQHGLRRIPKKINIMRLWWNWQRSLRSLQRQSRCCRICRADRLTALWTNPQPRSVSANMDSGASLKNQYHAPVVELADTLDLGSSARAWGFKSLQAHQSKKTVRSFQTVDKSPTLEIRCRAFSMRKNVVKH